MADLIRIKGGDGDVPELQDRELAYSKREKALYIGTSEGNKRLCGVDDISELNARIDTLSANIEALSKRIDGVTAIIDDITARLVVLETPSE